MAQGQEEEEELLLLQSYPTRLLPAHFGVPADPTTRATTSPQVEVEVEVEAAELVEQLDCLHWLEPSGVLLRLKLSSEMKESRDLPQTTNSLRLLVWWDLEWVQVQV